MTNFIRASVLLFSLCITWSVSGDITHPKVKWKFKTDGTIRGSSVIDGQAIYFGSADGFLYALQATTGDLIWKFKTNGAIANRPALSGSLVFISSRDNTLYAVDKNSGREVWRFTMKPPLEEYTEWEYYTASPVVHNDNVIIGSADGHVYMLNQNDGTLVWTFKIGSRIRATAVIYSESLYQPANDGYVYVLSMKDGKLQWKFQTEGATLDRRYGFDRTCLYTTPSVKDNLLVFGSRDGKVYGVDIRSRRAKWTFTYGSTWAYSTIAEDATVYVGWSTNNLFSAIDFYTGGEIWKFQCGSVAYTTATLTDTDVVFGSADGKLYGLNKKTGEKKWEYSVEAEIFSSPVYHDNVIYFGSDNGFFYALEDGQEPVTAVYQPLPKNNTNYPLLNEKIAPYLKKQGFKQLDSAQLYTFFAERIADKAPSVIVFAYDAIPANMIGDKPEEGMVRKYLEAGGKIIWFGSIPNMFSFDSKGKMMSGQRDLTTAERLLDVKFIQPEESGNYYCKTTQQGLNWGLPPWFKNTYSNVSPEQVIPLGIDEWNRVGPWMKKFNPRPGSGFISIRTWAWDVPIRDEDLELIYHLAMHELE